MEPAHAHPPPGFVLRDRGGEPVLLLLLVELRDRAMMLEGQKFVSHRRSDVARDAGELLRVWMSSLVASMMKGSTVATLREWDGAGTCLKLPK